MPSPSGFTAAAAEFVVSELSAMGYAPELTRKGCVLCCLGGEGAPLVLSAHIDTLGAMVAEVKANGRLRLAPVGGLRAENTEAENFTVYPRFGGAPVTGCFQICDPSVHVNGGYADVKRDFANMELVLDALTSSREETEALGVAAGDYACADPRTVITETGFIKSRFLDDKLSVVLLLALAKKLKEERIPLKRRVSLFITVYEEVGHGCAAGLPEDVEEIVSVDMGCVGEGLGCSETQVSICAKDSNGPSDYAVTSALIAAARAGGVDYAVDVYPHYGSDADAAVSAGYDVRHCVVGPGVYASHGYERTHMRGAEAAFGLVLAYVRADAGEEKA